MSVITPAGQVTAPVAPGQMGSALAARAAEVYVGELGRWRDARRRELDELDKAALQATTTSECWPIALRTRSIQRSRR